MKTCFFCQEIITTPDVTIDNIDACLPCGRIFNRIKIKLMKQMINDNSINDSIFDCVEFS
jgi:hypothetical protein